MRRWAVVFVAVALGCGSMTPAKPDAADAGGARADAATESPSAADANDLAQPDTGADVAVSASADALDADAAVDLGGDLATAQPDAAADADGGTGCDAGADAGAAAWELFPALAPTTTGFVVFPALALDEDEPVVAWEEDTVSFTKAWRKGACGGAWQPLGGPVAGTYPALASGGSAGVVRAYASAAGQIVVERWNGTAFVALGAPLGPSPGRATAPAVLADSAGNPVVAWVVGAASASSSIQVARWNGTQWIALADAAGVLAMPVLGGIPLGVSLTLLPDGAPVVAWPTYSHVTVVARFMSGTTWTAVGTPPPTDTGAGETNAPVVRATVTGELYLASMLRTTASTYHVTAAHLEAGDWKLLGGPLATAGSAHDFDLLIDATGAPVVASVEISLATMTDPLFTYRWSGTDWQPPAPPLSAMSSMSYVVTPHLLLDSRGRWVAAWGAGGTHGPVYVARHQP